MRIQVRLPRVEPDQYEVPETCPHGCGGRYFQLQRHGRQGLRKQVRDTQVG
jgi:hypothetical protein